MQTVTFNAHRRPDAKAPTYELQKNGHKFGVLVRGADDAWRYFDDWSRTRQTAIQGAATLRGDRTNLRTQLEVVRAIVAPPSAMDKAVAAVEDLGRRQSAEIAAGKPLERAMALLERRLGRR